MERKHYEYETQNIALVKLLGIFIVLAILLISVL